MTSHPQNAWNQTVQIRGFLLYSLYIEIERNFCILHVKRTARLI